MLKIGALKFHANFFKNKTKLYTRAKKPQYKGFMKDSLVLKSTSNSKLFQTTVKNSILRNMFYKFNIGA